MTKLNPFCVLSAMVCIALFVAFPAFAGSVVLEPIRDNSLFEPFNSTDPDVSNGTGAGLFSGTTGNLVGDPAERRALLLFEVSGEVPAGAIITSASLQLTVEIIPIGGSSDFDMSVHRVLSDWGEGTSNATAGGGGRGAAAETGDATWDHTFFDTDFWLTAGGDFKNTASATAAVGGVGVIMTWSGSSMVDDVQAWSDDPNVNFGWIVVGPGGEKTARRFGSRESLTPAQRPILTITFEEAGEGEGEGSTKTSGSGCYVAGDLASGSLAGDALLFLGALLALTALGKISNRRASVRK